MGPLVPEIIGNEFNYVVALLIGIAFGFVLEQAGFSSSRKLAGVFYGYDFTVLRVFFTAGVTAMAGVIVLSYFGLLDVELIYINPTYLWSAIVGGLIMGVGFIVGGFCPGTSVCAMAIGKIDAMIFVLGGILGVYVFAEGYTYFEPLYLGSFWGSVKIFETIGIPEGVFAFLMIIVAIGAFYATDIIERRVNRTMQPRDAKLVRSYFGWTAAAVLLAVALIFMPARKTQMLSEIQRTEYLAAQQIASISADELAFRLLDHDKTLKLIDVRQSDSFKKLTLPSAVNIQLDQLFSKDARDLLSETGHHYVFFGDNDMDGIRAAVLARNIGFENTISLKGGFSQFAQDILTTSSSAPAENRLQKDTQRFRLKAGPAIAQMIKDSRSAVKIVKQTKKISGGC